MKQESIGLPAWPSTGCNAKVRPKDLLHLCGRGDEDFAFLAPDCNPLAAVSSAYGTIDTILPVTKSPASYARIALNHAFNDLHAKGITVTDTTISFGFNQEDLTSPYARQLIACTLSNLAELNVRLNKAHTFTSPQTAITVSAIGLAGREQPRIVPNSEYSLILSKPLGCSLAFTNSVLKGEFAVSKEAEAQMLVGHHELTSSLGEMCYRGTTDISGFGLLGHLCALSKQQVSEVEVYFDVIPFFSRSLSLSSTLVNCSAERNLNDLDQFCDWKHLTAKGEKLLLYTAETSGPVLCVVDLSKSDSFLLNLHDNGFSSAKTIGRLKPSDKPKLTIK